MGRPSPEERGREVAERIIAAIVRATKPLVGVPAPEWAENAIVATAAPIASAIRDALAARDAEWREAVRSACAGACLSWNDARSAPLRALMEAK